MGLVSRPVAFGGILEDVLNVAGTYLTGVPVGSVAASKSPAAFGPITQNVQQIAVQVAPDTITALKNPTSIVPSKIPANAQQVAASSAQAIAVELANQGYLFPQGTQGYVYQNGSGSVFDAFGGQFQGIAEIGALGLGALLLFKMIRG